MAYSFKRAEGDISDELSAGGGHSESNSLVLDGVFGTSSGSEDILEHLVETELAHALGTVSDEGGEPSLKERVRLMDSLKQKIRLSEQNALSSRDRGSSC